MRKRIIAAIAVLAALFGTALVSAPAASAAPYYDYFTSPPWQPSQPTITLSDRNGYDLNENEAMTWWGIYGPTDGVGTVYTQYETCDYCIIAKTGTLAAGVVAQAQRTSYYYRQVTTSSGVKSYKYTRQCVITVDPAQVGTSAQKREVTMIHEIGHCLGFDHAPFNSIMLGSYNDLYSSGITNPTADDFYLLRKYYPSSNYAVYPCLGC